MARIHLAFRFEASFRFEMEEKETTVVVAEQIDFLAVSRSSSRRQRKIDLRGGLGPAEKEPKENSQQFS